MNKFFLTIISIFCAVSAIAQSSVTNIHVSFSNGQTFITWNNVSGSPHIYHVFKSAAPITTSTDLQGAEYLGNVRDSSTLNFRWSAAEGVMRYLHIDSASNPLTLTTGLFVSLTTTSGIFYYAITTEQNNLIEDIIIPGQNATTIGVNETIMKPVPIWQGTVVAKGGIIDDVYVLFVSNKQTNYIPLTSNLGSSYATFAVYKNPINISGPRPLLFYLPPGDGAFFNVGKGDENIEGLWKIGVDDRLPGFYGYSTGYFGYYEGFDSYNSYNSPPTSGMVRIYSLNKNMYILQWALKHFPLDSNRVYVKGSSNGGAGAVFMADMYPDKFASAIAVVGKVDLSSIDDPEPDYEFAEGTPARDTRDQMLGTISTNLITDFPRNDTEYFRTYELTSGPYMAHYRGANGGNSTPIFYIGGRLDIHTGWKEKVDFFDSLNSNQLGYVFFWDNRAHAVLNTVKYWDNGWYSNFSKYRLNLSYPAFSNCSINNNAGNGNWLDGDIVGNANGYITFDDTTIIDTSDLWQVKVYLNDLTSFNGTVSAPNSCLVDITPSRLQKFHPAVGSKLLYEVVSMQGTLLQNGTIGFNGGRITLPNLTILKEGVFVRIINPTVLIPQTTICSGQSISPILAPFVNSSAILHIDTVAPNFIHTYYSIGLLAGGILNTDTAIISINEVNGSVSSANPTICFGDSDALVASGGDSYLWSNGSTNNSIVVHPTADSTFSVTISELGCSEIRSTHVVVYPLPELTVVGGGTYCLGQDATLTATGGLTYLWNNGFTDSSITVNALNTVTYTVTGTDATGCSSSASASLQINEAPVVSAIMLPLSYYNCTATAAELHAAATNADELNWHITGSPSSLGNQDTFIAVASGSYYLVASNQCGSTNSNTLTVTLGKPVVSVVALTSTTICIGDTAKLGATQIPGFTYQWYRGTQINPFTSLPILFTPVSGKYKVKAIDPTTGCSIKSGNSVKITTQNCQREINEETVSDNPQLAIHPNPTSGIINIECQTSSGNISILISTITGVIVYRDQFVSADGIIRSTADLSGFPQGMYLIHIISGKEHLVQKVIRD